MLRRCSNPILDKTRAPTKIYKHSFMPDPRKFAPVETPRYHELFPRVNRPPCAFVPNTDAFLERIDIDEAVPMADFKAAFTSWDELVKSGPRQNVKVRGMSKRSAEWLAESLDDYRNGRLPNYYDSKAERKYFNQFVHDKIYNQNWRVPELPEKYRPHQMGEENPAMKSMAWLREQNKMPEWAIKEEERLVTAGIMKK